MASSITRNLLANFVGQGWTALMGLVFLPIYIRFLGIEAYGLIGVFAALQAWMSLLDFGIGPVLNREMTRMRVRAGGDNSARDLLHGAELLVCGGALLVAFVIFAASSWLATHWLHAEKLTLETVVASISIMAVVAGMRCLEGVYRAAALGQDRQMMLNALTSGLATVRGVGAIGVLAWVDPTIVAFLVWQLVMSVAACALLGVAVYGALPARPDYQFSIRALAPFRGFAGGMAAITLLSLLLTQVDKVLLSGLLNLQEYGYYTLAAVVASSLYLIVLPVTQSYFPRFTASLAAGDSVMLNRSFHQGAQLVVVLLAPAALVLAANSSEALRLWTHNAQLSQEAGPLLTALCVGTLLNGLMWIPYQMQLAHGHTQTALQVNIVAVALAVPAILWVTPRFGALGAAWVWCGLNAGYLLFGVNVMYRRMLRSERGHWYVHDVVLPVVVVIGVALLCRRAMPALLSNWQMAAWLLGTWVLAVGAAAGSATDLRGACLEALARASRERAAQHAEAR